MSTKVDGIFHACDYQKIFGHMKKLNYSKKTILYHHPLSPPELKN